ncbi:Vitamin B12 import ATP-binding protein BtuD [Nocardia sp. RB56]|uniref:Vitamin B12 import ATP-binding protein BtuD n=1 Tax=Nocardia aurantia TaxID=2585199 RepID=A0A7K0DN89_9NOCA|nr:Vitamin B12 import ATP-binding protein BtuD [Nocardia aurantia]
MTDTSLGATASDAADDSGQRTGTPSAGLAAHEGTPRSHGATPTTGGTTIPGGPAADTSPSAERAEPGGIPAPSDGIARRGTSDTAIPGGPAADVAAIAESTEPGGIPAPTDGITPRGTRGTAFPAGPAASAGPGGIPATFDGGASHGLQRSIPVAGRASTADASSRQAVAAGSTVRSGELGAAAARLAADGITVGYGGRVVIDGLTLDIESGLVTTIIGPNGCGKSTLLRTLGRLLRPKTGRVLLDGRAIATLSTKEVARIVGMLPQTPTAPEGLTVADLVARGRHPHQSWLRQWSSDDQDEVADALARTGVADLADRTLDELSGGQRQRAWISMALAQGTDILLLDEPTTYLDLAHSLEVLDLVDHLHADLGRTVVMVLHDLNLAARYSDRLIVMHGGRVVAQGAPNAVIDQRLLLEVFGLRAEVHADPVSGRPLIIPIGTRHVTGTIGGPASRPEEL